MPIKDDTEVKLTLRLPSTLHEVLWQMAEDNHRSINGQVLHLIAQAAKAQQASK